MKKEFKKYSLELEKDELLKFEKFLEIFIEKNSQINLSAIREADDIIEKHFIDSIILNSFFDFKENTSPQPSPLEEREFKTSKIKVADM
jgi:16S rRNA (guanine527-N7)-methyltransferase